MFSKFAIITLLVAITRCSASGGASSFSYGVSDPNTGDVKEQHERRIGDTVVGQYSLLEADGTKRIVEYSSNPQTGFNAVVKKDPAGTHPGLGYNGATPVTPGLGFTGANPLAHGGLNAWNPAGNQAYPGHGNGAYGNYGGYGVPGNGWNQNYGLNGGYGTLGNGWNQGGLTAGLGALGNGWAGSNEYNALNNGWNNNYAAGAFGSNEWPQNYGGVGSYGYGSASSPFGNNYGAHGVPTVGYSNRNSGW